MKVTRYGIANILAVLIAGYLFADALVSANDLQEMAADSGLIVLATVLTVFFLKGIRFYFIMSACGVSRYEFVKQYCKVIPVTLVLPGKLGDLFRVFCYGHLLGDYIKSAVFVAIDRFIDTIALLLILALFCILGFGKLTGVAYFLMAVVAIFYVAYLLFPGFDSYWRRALLRAEATDFSIKCLNLLKWVRLTYKIGGGILQGKGLALFVLSFVAWFAELGGLLLFYAQRNQTDYAKIINTYLRELLQGDSSCFSYYYMLLGVTVIFFVYGIMRTTAFLKGKEGNHADYSSI